jgi:hypothetical protein
VTFCQRRCHPGTGGRNRVRVRSCPTSGWPRRVVEGTKRLEEGGGHIFMAHFYLLGAVAGAGRAVGPPTPE